MVLIKRIVDVEIGVGKEEGLLVLEVVQVVVSILLAKFGQLRSIGPFRQKEEEDLF